MLDTVQRVSGQGCQWICVELGCLCKNTPWIILFCQSEFYQSMAGTGPCVFHKGAILASACCMPVTRQTMRKGRMACGGDNPPYTQITPALWLPGPSFCWQGPYCRSIFDLTSTANHRDEAGCWEEVGLFAYWTWASKVGGNVWTGARRRKAWGEGGRGGGNLKKQTKKPKKQKRGSSRGVSHLKWINVVTDKQRTKRIWESPGRGALQLRG